MRGAIEHELMGLCKHSLIELHRKLQQYATDVKTEVDEPVFAQLMSESLCEVWFN